MQEDVLSPLDGRYQKQLAPLTALCGPRAFAAARLRAEAAWLQTLAGLKLPGFKPFTQKEKAFLQQSFSLSETDLQILSDIEHKGYKSRPATNHDIKAIEYFLADKLGNSRANWVHFALTSEDINSAAYAQILSDAVAGVILPVLEQIRRSLSNYSRKYARSILLARTHGQPAVPTTFGREMKVFERRLARQLQQLKKQQISCKFGGAIGAYNAHQIAFPTINWPRVARGWLDRINKGRRMKLVLTSISTQVDPRDSYAELFDNLRRLNTILLDFSQDMWHYISAGLVKQKVIAGEVGSSTMPQKVNPIDFENAEGNLGLATALLEFLSRKLPISRLQRDLSDSTVLRNIPVALGHCVLAYQSLLKGLNKTTFDVPFAQQEVLAHPEVLAEAYQTLLRAAGVPDAYEKIKQLTRARIVKEKDLRDFIFRLNLDKKLTQKLVTLHLRDYIGLAVEQARGDYD